MKCIVCGKNDAFKFGLCTNCLSDKIRLKTSKMEITFCPKCGAVKINKKWYYDNVENIIKKQATANISSDNSSSIEITNYSMNDRKMNIDLIVDDKNLGEIQKETDMDIKIINESCPVCNRVTGSYYEAVIQLRTFTTEFDNILNSAKDSIVSYIKSLNKNNPNSFISRIEKKKEGLDILLGRKEDAVKIDKNLDDIYFMNLKITKSLAGRKDGKDMFRYTHLIRILDLLKGSVIYDKNYYMVKSISSNNIELLDIDRGTDINLNSKNFFRKPFNIIYKFPEKEKFIVLSSNSNETQIMSSENFNIMSIKGKFENGEIILYKYNGNYFSL